MWRPLASNSISSCSAMPTPIEMPPSTWPSTSIGLIGGAAVVRGDDAQHSRPRRSRRRRRPRRSAWRRRKSRTACPARSPDPARRSADSTRRCRSPAGRARPASDAPPAPIEHVALRKTLDLDFAVLGLELADLHAQHGRRRLEQNGLGRFGGEPDGVAGDVGGAAGDGAGVHRRRVGIGGDDVHVVGGDAERLGRDLAEHRERALARFRPCR